MDILFTRLASAKINIPGSWLILPSSADGLAKDECQLNIKRLKAHKTIFILALFSEKKSILLNCFIKMPQNYKWDLKITVQDNHTGVTRSYKQLLPPRVSGQHLCIGGITFFWTHTFSFHRRDQFLSFPGLQSLDIHPGLSPGNINIFI